MEDVATRQPWWSGVIFKDAIKTMHVHAPNFIPRGGLDLNLTYVCGILGEGPPFFLKNQLIGRFLWVIIGAFRNLMFETLTVVFSRQNEVHIDHGARHRQCQAWAVLSDRFLGLWHAEATIGVLGIMA